mgnify:CR=1 FL=1
MGAASVAMSRPEGRPFIVETSAPAAASHGSVPLFGPGNSPSLRGEFFLSAVTIIAVYALCQVVVNEVER